MVQPTNMYRTFQEDNANAIGSFREVRLKYNPYNNTYNLGWRNHLNFSYAGNNESNTFYHPPSFPNPKPTQQY